MKTYVPKKGEIERKWWIVDAEGKHLGRLCTVIADHLSGKKKPVYTPFIDVGDHVIVINASRVVLTGKKLQDKAYRHYSGYPGGLKEIRAGKLLAQKPQRVIELAVWGMLPKSKIGKAMFRKLKVYAGGDHPHAAQKPHEVKL